MLTFTPMANLEFTLTLTSFFPLICQKIGKWAVIAKLFFFSFLFCDDFISQWPSMCFFCIILFFILYYEYAKIRQYRHSWNMPLYQWGSNIIALLLFLSLPWVCLALIKHSLIKSTKTRTKVGLKFELLTVLNPMPFQKWDLSGVLGKWSRNWMWKREGIDESWGKERTVW